MRLIHFMAIALIGFAVMVVSALDYFANAGQLDVYVFIAGTAALAAGYAMSVRAMRAGEERSRCRPSTRTSCRCSSNRPTCTAGTTISGRWT